MDVAVRTVLQSSHKILDTLLHFWYYYDLCEHFKY